MSETNSGLRIDRAGEVDVVTITDSTLLDPLAIQAMGDDLEKLVNKSDRPKIVVAMDRVTRVSSGLLGMLLGIQKLASQKKEALRVAGPSEQVTNLFKMTKIDKLIKVHSDVDSALKRF